METDQTKLLRDIFDGKYDDLTCGELASRFPKCAPPPELVIAHDLKIWPEYFQSVVNKSKKSEVRINDRNFCVGDILILREWNPKTKKYTGNECQRKVTHITKDGTPGIELGYCVMSIE